MSRVTVIYTDDTKPRRYVLTTGRRDEVCDNNILAELTTDKSQAHDFGSATEAKEVITRIHNPFNRTYKHETIVTDLKKTSRVLSGDIN